MDRDHWGYQSYEASPSHGDVCSEEVAPAAGFDSLPHLALPKYDGDAVEAIRSIVGFPDRKDPE